ncbi:MAG: DUF882 domain-containing protein [Sphingomonadaceae bacterium]|nr:DUF882 domain-containing protein [Sphingomonadaceae bacterium]
MLDRRALLGGGAALAALTVLPSRALAPARTFAPAGAEHRLALRNVHNGERHDVLFARGGVFLPGAIDELNHALRDWRNGAIEPIDHGLLMLAGALRDTLGVSPRTHIDLISGYRSPATNASLNAHSDGVASRSQHLLGKAMDLAVPGVPLDRVHRAALSLRGGGVGYYPADGFVHIDTGRPRIW